MSALQRAAEGAISLLYPRLCPVCGRTLVRGEGLMCLECRMELPRTDLHHTDPSLGHQRVIADAPVERTAAYFYYKRDSSYARLIHNAKYNGRPSLARRLASEFASMIAAEGFFDGIDMIEPVPMHTFKRWRRGYNQADYIARGISDATGIAVGDHLRATRSHSTQTHLGAAGRWQNTQGIYTAAHTAEIAGKHLLVVDDVLTTGATLTHCINALAAASPTSRFSILTLAATI